MAAKSSHGTASPVIRENTYREETVIFASLCAAQSVVRVIWVYACSQLQDPPRIEERGAFCYDAAYGKYARREG
jgi:hypothetical protein